MNKKLSKCRNQNAFFFVECHFVGWYKEPGSLFTVIEVICNTPVAQCIQLQCVYPKHLLRTPHLL